jgi:hypothetical protein
MCVIIVMLLCDAQQLMALDTETGDYLWSVELWNKCMFSDTSSSSSSSST